MKNRLQYALLISGFFISGMTTAYADTRYEVTVTNLTRGQVMSPVVAISHNKRYHLFELGGVASDGLAALAQDADSSVLVSELENSDNVLAVSQGTAPFGPGASQTVIIHTKGNKKMISLASMLVTTNDGFYALNGVRAPKGKKTARYMVPAYDAGSEDNNEDCAYIPGPPCGHPFKATAVGGEGLVHIHAGIHNLGEPTVELDAATHDWRNPVASIKIRKIDDEYDD
jgi:hypothetical protein